MSLTVTSVYLRWRSWAVTNRSVAACCCTASPSCQTVSCAHTRSLMPQRARAIRRTRVATMYDYCLHGHHKYLPTRSKNYLARITDHLCINDLHSFKKHCPHHSHPHQYHSSSKPALTILIQRISHSLCASSSQEPASQGQHSPTSSPKPEHASPSSKKLPLSSLTAKTST